MMDVMLGLLALALVICAIRLLKRKENSESERSPALAEEDINDLDSVDEILETAFQDFRAGRISLAGYANAIAVQEARLIRAASTTLEREAKRPNKLDERRPRHESLQDAREAISWRYEWIEEVRIKPELAEYDFPDRVKWTQFDYDNSDGGRTKWDR